MSTTEIKHFLLVFDHGAGKLVDEIDFGTDSEAAIAAYAACEEKHRGRDMIEIVLIGSDSLDTIRVTHANYFDETVTVSKFLAGMG